MNKDKTIENFYQQAVTLLRQLIQTSSVSRHEEETAHILEEFFREKNIEVERVKNNVFAKTKNFDTQKKTLFLNSHHDTVPANKKYTLNPHEAIIKDDKLYGLGSNDAGASLVSLLVTFLYFYNKEIPFNIIFAASAEEEVSGRDGIELLLTQLPRIDMAIVGEPTQMKLAVAEKGLLVLDCVASGRPGHAARDEGENAIHKAVGDIQWIENFTFEKISPWLGNVHTAVTSIETENKAHNVVPDSCRFIIDIRVNELYSFEEVIDILHKNLKSSVTPRSLRLKPSFIAEEHILVKSAEIFTTAKYGSPTCSDMALMNFPAIKCGPGDSARSHSADEFIYLYEIKEGIEKYIRWIERLSELIKI